MPETAANQGTGVPLKALGKDARVLSAEEFEERHGSAFLLLTAAELRCSNGPASTEIRVVGLDEAAAEDTASLSLLVYPVRRTERSVGHLIAVGRTSNNDVVIPDVSVSRFHAFIKESADGRFQIQDAKSTNGTTVNRASVPAQGQGLAMELKSGDNVRFGQVELTFLGVDGLRNFVLASER
jgi:hypothetical protein